MNTLHIEILPKEEVIDNFLFSKNFTKKLSRKKLIEKA